MGRARYPQAKRILITADGGGSNGSRCRLWKKKLQDFADAWRPSERTSPEETGVRFVEIGADSDVEEVVFAPEGWRHKALVDGGAKQTITFACRCDPVKDTMAMIMPPDEDEGEDMEWIVRACRG